jgi:hypothetical protein
MSLRPEFSQWFESITLYTYRGKIRKMFPLRSDDFFGSADQWPSVLKRAEEKLKDKGVVEKTVVLESLRILNSKIQENQSYSEIVFTKQGKPFYILDNVRVMYPNDKNLVVHMEIDLLIRHGYITNEMRIQEKEAARWKVIRLAAFYAAVCVFLTARKI